MCCVHPVGRWGAHRHGTGVVALSAQSQGGVPRDQRLAVAVSVLLVLELVAGFTGLAVKRRLADAPSAPHTVVWTPGAEPEPYVAAAPTEDPVPDIVVTVRAAETATPAASVSPPSRPEVVQTTPQAPAPSPRTEPAPAEPAAAPAPPSAPAAEPRMRAASAETDSERVFRERFPVQAAARQVEGDRATFHWAVLVGVNRYEGRTKDTIGSVADATLLRAELLRRGWREDHILLLTDHQATHDDIVRGLEWLARKTDPRSVVVFSFSGHMRYQKGDPDGDGEYRDSGLWPSDNRYLWDADFVRMIDAVRAERMWLSFQGCHSGGMNDPGLERPGRLVTYSSLEREKSYEDPEVNHSVTGWYMFAEGMRDRFGDGDRDGRVSVQEAHAWATPRAYTRTTQRQSMQITDGVGHPFHLEVS